MQHDFLRVRHVRPNDPATRRTRRADCNPDKRHRDSRTRRDAPAGGGGCISLREVS
jgi:hypothetical protein